jgi:hypothetical protein
LTLAKQEKTMDTKTHELSTEELDSISGSGIVSDATNVLVAGCKTIMGIVNDGLAIAGAGHATGSGGPSGGAPKGTWL